MKKYIIALFGMLPVLLLATPAAGTAQTSVPAQTYHITFHFSSFIDMITFTITSEDTLYSDVITSNPMSMDLPEGYYSLVAQCNTLHIIFTVADRLHVYKNMDTTISMLSASHLIILNMADETGNPIPDNVNHKANETWIFFDFGQEYKRPVQISNFPGWWQDSVYMSDIPATMQVRLFRSTVVNKGQQYHHYLVSYPTLTGLSGDTLMCNAASDLLNFPLIFNGGPAYTYYYGWGKGMVYNTRMGGNTGPFIFAGLDAKSPTKRIDTVMVHTMPVAGDSVLAWPANGIIHITGSISTENYIWSPIFFTHEDQSLVLSENGYPFCPADIRVQPGNESVMGISPPFNFMISQNPPASNFLQFSTLFKGYSNEERRFDISKTTMQIYQNQQLLFDDTLTSYNVNFGLPSAAPCTVIQNNRNYTLYGKQGYLKSLAEMDPSNSADPDPPAMISFRILQGDFVKTEVVRGFPATASFTAGDFFFDNNFLRHCLPIQNASLFYKDYASDHWEQLTVIPDLAHFDSLSGMPYLADLSVLQGLPSDSVWVDIRIELTDFAGNMTVQEIHPAFLLRDIVTGSALPDESDLLIYPNPTDRYLFFSGACGNDLYRISDLKGEELLSGKCSDPADLAGFAPGIYVVRIFDNQGMQKSTEKVVRTE